MAQKSKLKKRLIIGILTVVGATFLMSLLAFWNPLEKWQLKLTNHLYNRNEPSDEITIIAIEENSLDEDIGLGKWGTWDRTYYAQVIENLENAGAKVIGIDLLLTDKSSGINQENWDAIIQSNLSLREYFDETSAYFTENDHPSDIELANIFKKYSNIILIKTREETVETNATTFSSGTYPLSIFEKNVETAWAINYADKDGVLRRIPYKIYDAQRGEEDYTLAIKIAQMYQGKFSQEVEENIIKNSMLINYSAPPFSFKRISFIDAYNNQFNKEDIEGKIILIGPTTERLKDVLLTPTSTSILMPGVEMHANAIQTILEQKFLHEESVQSQAITIAMLTALLVIALLLLGVIPGLAITIITIAGYYLSGQFFFNHGLIINFVYPIIALFAAYLTITLYKSLAETQEKKQLTSAFSKYVNKDLVAQIANNPDVLKLGGEKRTVTVFFSDIENSTSLSEKMDPESLVSLLNEYFTVMTGIILKNKGTVNKFEGDAIMAFWGAPIPEPQHAILAARSAIECRVALKALHEKWQKEGKPLIEFRIGLASGEVIAGNIGSQDRFDYTVMGDIVNLGSRLEGANKEYGTRIMISDLTFAAIQNEFETRHLDHLRVKGKENPVDVYELLTFKGKLEDRHRQIIDTFHAAVALYRDGKFIEAEQKFQEVKKLAPLDKTTDIYLSRLAQLKQNPPANWDGTWTLENK